MGGGTHPRRRSIGIGEVTLGPAIVALVFLQEQRKRFGVFDTARLLTKPHARLSSRREQCNARADELLLFEELPKDRCLAGACGPNQNRQAVVRQYVQREGLLVTRLLLLLIAPFQRAE